MLGRMRSGVRTVLGRPVVAELRLFLGWRGALPSAGSPKAILPSA